MKLCDLKAKLDYLLKVHLAYDWDNVGLCIGSLDEDISSITLSLELCDEVIDDAIKNKSNMIIVHHPLIFTGIKNIVDNDHKQKMIIKLIKNNIALYVAHTNFDIIEGGLNDYVINLFSVEKVQPLTDDYDINTLGRLAVLKEPMSLKNMVCHIQEKLNSKNIRSMDVVVENATTNKKNNNTSIMYEEASLILEPFSMKLIVKLESFDIHVYAKDGYIYTAESPNLNWEKRINQKMVKEFLASVYNQNEVYDILKNNIDKIELEEIKGNYIITILDPYIIKDLIEKHLLIGTIDDTPKKILIDDEIFLKYIVDKKTLLPIAFIFSANISYEYGVENLTVGAKYFNINNVKRITLPNEVKNAKLAKKEKVLNNEYLNFLFSIVIKTFTSFLS